MNNFIKKDKRNQVLVFFVISFLLGAFISSSVLYFTTESSSVSEVKDSPPPSFYTQCMEMFTEFCKQMNTCNPSASVLDCQLRGFDLCEQTEDLMSITEIQSCHQALKQGSLCSSGLPIECM